MEPNAFTVIPDVQFNLLPQTYFRLYDFFRQRIIFILIENDSYPFTGVQLMTHFQPMNCKHSQGATDVRHRAHRRPFVL